MTDRRLLWEITRWELFRWLKLKDQLQTFLISIVLGLVIWGGIAAFQKVNRGTVQIAVLNHDRLPFTLPESGELKLAELSGRSEDELVKALGRHEIDALLRLSSSDEAELLITREPVWKGELERALNSARQQLELAASDLDPQVLAQLSAPVELSVSFHENAGQPTSLADKVAAGLIIGLMILGVFVGFAYQFVAITGEKQLRVTELIVSAVKPQMWIDGKILGISLLAFCSTGTYLLSGMVFVLFSKLFGDGLPIPLAVTDPMLWIQFALLALGGLLLWNTFFGLVAATIDDPNTSSRGSLILLPLLPLAIAFVGMNDPDTWLMRFLALIPPTSPTVLTLRLVLTEVALWELPLALLLLVAAIWLLRRAAGKVFGLAILMYGKEPTWREITGWIREV